MPLVALAPAARRFRCTCVKCGAERELESASFDAAWTALRSAGWLDLARKGKRREAYPWWCAACAPAGSRSMGRSTI